MSHKKSSGFTYLGLLFILVLIGITLAMAGTLWSFAQKRELERQLLFIGSQFKRAIGLYYEHTPGVIKRYPNTLTDLLEDNRYVSKERYLRRIYLDPVSNSNEWGLVRAPDGGIMGVYSLSDKKMVRVVYSTELNNLTVKVPQYSDWKFTYLPVSVPQPR